MKHARSLAAYAAGHFLIDLACAFVMFRFVRQSGSWRCAVLLYNLFAFAGQAPLGLLADRLGNGRLFAAGGCLIVCASFLMAAAPAALAVTAGLGNALYHIGGGYDTLSVSGGKAGPLGVFVSPGAFGLFLGGMLGKGAFPAWCVIALLLAAAAAIPVFCGAVRAEGVSAGLSGAAAFTLVIPREGPRLRGRALVCLFSVVCLRSYTGFLFAFPWKTGAWAWVFALCVVLGKALGGLAQDRFGAGRAALFSLGPAAALFLLSGSAPCGCAAVLLFNMTMPVTLRAAADLMPRARGFSFGLLTLALFLGFLPTWAGLPGVSEAWVYAALALVSLALLIPALRRQKA